MVKIVFFLSLISFSSEIIASSIINLYQAPLTRLNQFKRVEQLQKRAMSRPEINTLMTINQTEIPHKTITRYQQFYRGIPVIGAQVMIAKDKKRGLNTELKSWVSGRLVEEIQLNTHPTLSAQAALHLAKNAYFESNSQLPTTADATQLQIRTNPSGHPTLTYLVSFKTINPNNNKPTWPFFLINAHTGEMIKQWDNIKAYLDTGPGGNEKTNEYWYGKDGLPALDVTQIDNNCIMENDKVKLINVGSEWDWGGELRTPYQYTCNNNNGDPINGAFSPNNDAYYFGHVIIDMYKNWYGLNALQHKNGEPMKLVMRTHFGELYDNAFWDGQTMTFGDGEDFYPLVSLDVAGHEVTHGFTEQHSNLEYHDQSGSLNESLSDMAGQTARAYLLQTNPDFYNKAYAIPNQITWGIGETITRDSLGKALRFMDFPSSDGSSADCFDKSIAEKSHSFCAISYQELITNAERSIPNIIERQNYIVHRGSGIFNRVFYLLSEEIGLRKAYQIMINANISYWTPTTDFESGACGVLHAADDLQTDRKRVQSIFEKVGIDTVHCHDDDML